MCMYTNVFFYRIYIHTYKYTHFYYVKLESNLVFHLINYKYVFNGYIVLCFMDVTIYYLT